MQSQSGWIALHRKITEWEWYSDINASRLFIHLLLTANHKDQKWRGKIIKRGQRIFGRKLLAQEVGLSVQKLRTALEKLLLTNELTIESSPQGSLVTVVRYNDYQDSTNKITNEQPTNNQRITNEQPLLNNDNNDNNDNNIPPNPLKGVSPLVRKNVSLKDLSIEHVADWLAEKRMEGKYVWVDEYALLEYFKDYCSSKGKTYKNYIAAFRNAFKWNVVDTLTNNPAEGKNNAKRNRHKSGTEQAAEYLVSIGIDPTRGEYFTDQGLS